MKQKCYCISTSLQLFVRIFLYYSMSTTHCSGEMIPIRRSPGAQPGPMSKTKIHSIVQSFIIVPMLATTLSLNTVTVAINNALQNQAAATQEVSAQEKILQATREERAAKIDAYYAKNGMPLEGYGMKMVLEAEEHDIDWRLIPAISVRESTGGKFACKTATYSAFGWGSCKISFKSYDHAIESLAANFGGENPRTARYYHGKSVVEILQKYNPPSVVPNYAKEVMAIMSRIEETTI